jgi:hypothetical protein
VAGQEAVDKPAKLLKLETVTLVAFATRMKVAAAFEVVLGVRVAALPG